MGKTLITFGDLDFSAGGISAEVIERESGQDLATYELATGKVVSEFVGEKLKRLTVKISAFNLLSNYGINFRVDIKKLIGDLENMLSTGEGYTLMFSGGVYRGSYLLTNIRESIIRTLPDGTISAYNASLELLEEIKRENDNRDTYIRQVKRNENQEIKKSLTLVEEREKKDYSDLMKSKKIINPLYSAFTYAKKVLL